MKLFSKLTILSVFIVILLPQLSGLGYALELDELGLPKTSVNPGSFYYPFKRLLEKGQEKLLFFADSRRSFYSSLFKTRLAELSYVVNNKILSEVQGSSERFAYQAGILTEEMIGQKDEDRQKTVEVFKRYSDYLAQLRDQYAANSSFWMLIQHDINTLKILSDKLR